MQDEEAPEPGTQNATYMSGVTDSTGKPGRQYRSNRRHSQVGWNTD